MKKLQLLLIVFILNSTLLIFNSSAQYSRTKNKTSVVYRDNYQRIATGMAQTFEIRNGTLWAWGENIYGQLGDGSTIDRDHPVKVGSDTKWAGVATGQSHSVGLKSDGTLWAWGYNGNGQLGDGTAIDRHSPVKIGSNNTWVSVTTGFNNTLALKSDGTLWAWGSNAFGELGDGTTTEKHSPVQVGSDNKWISISGGRIHTLGLKSDGTLWSWGSNFAGALGIGSVNQEDEYDPHPSPVQVGSDNDWVSVAAGHSFSVGVKSDGTLWTWGWNIYGQLGIGNNTTLRSSPVLVGSDNHWVSVAAGSSITGHTLALKSDGTLWAWGSNGAGKLGDGTTSDRNSPVQVGNDNHWISIAAGSSHSLALKSDGTLWAWGLNNKGQLGDGTIISRYSPVQMNTSLSGWESIAVSPYHTLALKSDGAIWSWGSNFAGALGIGSVNQEDEYDPHPSPVQVGSDNDWVSVAAGHSFSVGVKSDGTLWTWGWNIYGQLGIGNNTTLRSSPVRVGSDNHWVSVAAGSSSTGHTLALKSDGTLWAWGSNGAGKLGDGTTTDRNSPVQVGNDNNWISIAAGSSHSLALKSDGTLWAWGLNNKGQLGDGTTSQINNPAQIGIDNHWTSIAAGASHSLALKSDGTLWAWGLNDKGQLGDGTNTDRLNPVRVGTGINWVSTAAGENHSLAKKSDGTLWVWGFNGSGQLGDGTFVDKISPVKITSQSNVVVIGAGGSQTGVVKSDMGYICMTGKNDYGQLGDATIVTRNTFVCGVSAAAPGVFAVSISPLCSGNTLSLFSGGGVSYAWTGPNGFTSSQQNPVITNAGTDQTGIYIVTVTSSGGSTATASASVTVNPTPAPTLAPSDSSFCSGGKTNLRLASNLSSTTWSITPVVTGGTVSGAVHSAYVTIVQTLNNTGTTTALVTYPVIATKGGCSSTVYATVHVYPKPTGTTTVSSTSICSGINAGITLNPNADPELGALTTFTWTALTTGTIGTPTPVACTDGCGSSISDLLMNDGIANGSVKYTVTPWANGCKGANLPTVSITVKPIPVALFTTNGDTAICSGTTPKVKFKSTTALTKFSWSAPSVINPAGGSITGGLGGTVSPIAQKLVNNGTSQGIVTYTITPNYLNCIGSPITANITVNPVPNGTVTPTSETINPNTLMNATLNQGTTDAPTTFTWTSVAAPTITGPSSNCTDHSGVCGTSITDALGNTGLASAKVTYSILPWAYGCSGKKITHAVTVRPKPIATSRRDTTICSGGKPNLKLTSSTSLTTFVWTAHLFLAPVGGTIMAEGIHPIDGIGTWTSSGATINTVLTNVGGTTPGKIVFTITPVYQTSAGNAIYDTVTVNPVPTGSASPSPAVICSNSATGVILTPGDVAGTHFSWTASVVSSIGNAHGCTDTTGLCGTSIPDMLITTSTAGPKEVYTITPWANGCAGTSKVIVNVTVQFGTPAKPVVTGIKTAICPSPASYLYTVTNAGPNTVNWTLPTGCTMISHTASYDQVSITYPSGYVSDSVKARVTNQCGITGSSGGVKTSSTGSVCRSAGTVYEASVQNQMDMKVYPNPAHDKLNVEFSSEHTGEYLLKMFDMTGRLVISRISAAAAGENHIELDMGDFARGIYVLSFSSGEESKQVRVVVE